MVSFIDGSEDNIDTNQSMVSFIDCSEDNIDIAEIDNVEIILL